MSVPRPRVTIKWAQTLDGRLATSTGHSRWISGEEARILAHELRAEHDAVLVGIGTVEADNPELTSRLVRGHDPLRVVLDSRLRIDPGAAVVRPGTVIATSGGAPADRERALVERGVEVIRTISGDPRVEVPTLLEALADRGVRRVLIEGGSAVITSFLRLRLADEVIVVVAPLISGSGIDAVGNLGVTMIDNCIRFEQASFSLHGTDTVFRGRPRWPA